VSSPAVLSAFPAHVRLSRASGFPGCRRADIQPSAPTDHGEKLIELCVPQPRVDAGDGRFIQPCSAPNAMISSAKHKAVAATS
jgi:hypothetical protein